MASISLKNLTKSFANRTVLDRINCLIEPGLFTVVLGPSGCGKSTLLRLIAGLDRCSEGDILINGQTVNDTAPKDRGCAMVFQNYALYPHMSVSDNLGYSLKLMKWSKQAQSDRIAEVAKLLGISSLLDYKPHELSGGQSQRVAIGRAIARKPDILLLDEPLSNLDPKLRAELRIEFRHMHERLKTTTVYVTHDQAEAMTLADRIILLNQGHIEQIGTPDEIYFQPASSFVARFIGTPPMNLINAESNTGGLVLTSGEKLCNQSPSAVNTGEPVLVGIRPEDLKISEHGFPATVVFKENLGSHTLLHCLVNDHKLVISSSGNVSVKPKDKIRVALSSAEPCFFDVNTGLRIENTPAAKARSASPMNWPVPGPVIAHRGASLLAPENTIPAFEATAQAGCQWVETDVKLSADGHPVIFHDNIVDRVSSGTGPLANLTLEEISSLDVGAHFSSEFKGAKVPHLDEALQCFLDCDLGVVLEIKPTSGSDRETAVATIKSLKSIWPACNKKLLITSASTVALMTAHRLAPEFRYGLSALMPPPDPTAALANFHCTALHCDYRYLTKAALQRLTTHKIEFAVATVNDRERANQLLHAGATGIITDRIDLLND